MNHFVFCSSKEKCPRSGVGRRKVAYLYPGVSKVFYPFATTINRLSYRCSWNGLKTITELEGDEASDVYRTISNT